MTELEKIIRSSVQEDNPTPVDDISIVFGDNVTLGAIKGANAIAEAAILNRLKQDISPIDIARIMLADLVERFHIDMATYCTLSKIIAVIYGDAMHRGETRILSTILGALRASGNDELADKMDKIFDQNGITIGQELMDEMLGESDV